MERKRVYIVVKTYPTISEKYAELVCTAGILEDGSWIRLFPMPFRLLNDDQKYPKFTWIEVDVERHTADIRPESYRPIIETLQVAPKQKVNWTERRRIIFNNQKIYTNKSELIAQKNSDNTSLAIFKPTKINDFVVEQDNRDWDAKKLESLHNQSQQLNLFQTPEQIEEEFRVVAKVPYKFSYKFEDDTGVSSTLMIEDWEIGMLYFKCLKRAGGDEKVAVAKVREKYFDEFLKKDLHLFLGTTKQYHSFAPNPFIIVGVFYPPLDMGGEQLRLF